MYDQALASLCSAILKTSNSIAYSSNKKHLSIPIIHHTLSCHQVLRNSAYSCCHIPFPLLSLANLINPLYFSLDITSCQEFFWGELYLKLLNKRINIEQKYDSDGLTITYLRQTKSNLQVFLILEPKFLTTGQRHSFKVQTKQR